MSIQGYSTVASRNLIRAELEMLEHAQPIEVLAQFGMQKTQPTRKTDTVVFRRVNPFNMGSNGAPRIDVNNFEILEGVTPNSNTISYTDVSVTLKQYGVLFKFTSKAELMYEDDIPSDMAKVCGETMAEVAEKIRYGVIKGGVNVVYSNGSTRAGVATPISLARLRLCTRTLENARARMVTQRLSAGPDFGTSPVEPGYLVFIHTDVESDVRNLPGFTKVEEYAQRKLVHDRELGSVERFRFITSPLFEPFLAAGAAVGTTGMLSAGAVNLDVYPTVIVAEDAWGQIALKGMGAVEPTILKATTKNHANPMGQFGYVGCNFWMNAVLLNQNFMVRLESAATAL
jgi:N4-gp56 family major capsid protein